MEEASCAMACVMPCGLPIGRVSSIGNIGNYTLGVCEKWLGHRGWEILQ